MTPRTLRLRDHLDLVRRQALLIGVVAVGAAALAVAVASLQDDVYASTAAVRIAAVADPRLVDGAEATANDRTRELVTEVEIIGSTSIADLVRARLGPEPPTFGPVTATLVGFSEVVTIRVEAPDPTVAAQVANAYAEVFVEQRRERVVAPFEEQVDQLSARADAVRAELARVESLLAAAADDAAVAAGLRATQDAALDELQELGDRIGAFEAAAVSGAEATVLVSTAEVEADPVSPDRTRNGLVGLALGLALGLGAGILRDLVQDRVAGVVDVASIDPELPVLAGVPRSGRRGSTDAAADAYRGLDAAVRLAAVDHRDRTVAVTSAVEGEPAAAVAVGLARASAAAGARVALVDCDLRRPSVHAAFGLEPGPGLVEVLRGDVAVDAALQRPVEGVEGLEVLGAGGATDATGELLSGERFARLVADLADRAELTVLLAPPVLPVADALWIGRHAGAALVVARVGTTRRADVVDAVARLRGVAVPVLGTVVVDVPPGGGRRAYVAARA